MDQTAQDHWVCDCQAGAHDNKCCHIDAAQALHAAARLRKHQQFHAIRREHLMQQELDAVRKERPAGLSALQEVFSWTQAMTCSEMT